MIIEGIVTGTLINNKTGESREAFSEKNHIQNDKLAYYANANLVTYQGFGDNLFISELDSDIQRRDWMYIQQAVIGETPGGVTSPEFQPYAVGNVHRYYYTQQFPPGAAQRSINLIGITNAIDQSGIDSYNGDVHAIVRLALPCIQETDETLVVQYRIQVSYNPDFYTTGMDTNTAGEMSPEELRIVTQQIFEGGPNFLHQSTADVTAIAFNKFNPRKIKYKFDPFYTLNTITTTRVDLSDPTLFKHKFRHEVPLNTAQGL